MSGSELEPNVRAAAERILRARVTALDALLPGLGTRRFFRVHLEGAAPATAIARVEVPDDPSKRPGGARPEPPLEPIRAFLAAHGWPVPERYGADAEHGIELLEDLGDRTLEQVAREPDVERRRALYAEACALVPRLQQLRAPRQRLEAFERRLDEPLFAFKAEQLLEWGLPHALGRPVTPAEAKCVREAFSHVAAVCRAAPARLSHRDFKAANLHVPDAPAARGRTIVAIDLQGAFLAPPEYDLVCLLHDSHVPLPVSEIDAQLGAVRERLPDAPPLADFSHRFHLLSCTRVGKDLAFYVRAWRQRDDDRYLAFLPHATRILKRSAARAARRERRLAGLAEIFQELPEAPCAP